ncbi:NADP-dependent oxidoreductase [Isoptericola sp. NPDC057191]|uniref:NADP-dependent oxidoreductase n=1 Tax=Isoptericola sp. NPDC057191 TaxID=3346041 RepID=UPI00364082D6
MSSIVSTQVQLAARPTGWPVPDDFRTVQVSYGDLEPGQVRVANEFVSVDPYMRGRMNDVKSYVPPFALGETMTGGAVGRVVESASDDVPVGAVVLHQHGWRDVVQEDARGFQVVPELPGAPLSLHLGILGMTGLTGYVGLTAIAGMQPGDTVFVSGAAGAVGTAAGQIARLLGAGRVVGSAGSPEKVDLLTSKYGYDAALNYKDAPVREQLPALVPDGVDVFFDNVGGDHLTAALDVMNDGGRVALCGAIAGYNTTDRLPGPDNMPNLITRGLRLQGFTLGGYLHHAAEYRELMSGWFADGKVAYDETVVDGIENAPQAFIDMMRGANTGKMVVRTAR